MLELRLGYHHVGKRIRLMAKEDLGPLDLCVIDGKWFLEEGCGKSAIKGDKDRNVGFTFTYDFYSCLSDEYPAFRMEHVELNSCGEGLWQISVPAIRDLLWPKPRWSVEVIWSPEQATIDFRKRLLDTRSIGEMQNVCQGVPLFFRKLIGKDNWQMAVSEAKGKVLK